MVQLKQKHLIPYIKCQQCYALRRVKLHIRLEDAADLSEEHRDLCVTPVRFRVELITKALCFGRTRFRGFLFSTTLRIGCITSFKYCKIFLLKILYKTPIRPPWMGLSCLMHLNCDKTFFLSVLKNKSTQVSFAYFDHSRIKSTILY